MKVKKARKHDGSIKYLPTIMVGIELAHTWNMAPNEKTPTATMRECRRPSQSARGEEASAPTTVPALRIDTINDVWLGKILTMPLSSTYVGSVEKSSRNASISRMPFIELDRGLIVSQIAHVRHRRTQNS